MSKKKEVTCPVCNGSTTVPKYEGSDELIQCPNCNVKSKTKAKKE